MTAVLAILGLGDAAWLTHFIATHRTGLSTVAATFATALLAVFSRHHGRHRRPHLIYRITRRTA
jgi:uncharacterized membrane protein YjjB (DUF3815 family)